MLLAETAISAAISAGRTIMKIYNDPAADFSVERKADNSALTMADKAAHEVIVQHLERTGLPVLSEEGKSIPYETRKHWKTFWLVDPLDGTKEFIKRNGEFTVNIALIEENIPVLGVIYVPVTATLYAGTTRSGSMGSGSLELPHSNSGAWKITRPEPTLTWEELTVSGQKLPTEILPDVYTVAGSRSHRSPETEEYINNLEQEYGEVNIVSSGSSLKICMVAEGSAHEYPRFGPTMEWDTAAGHAIASAAGKKLLLTDFSGELVYNKESLVNPYFVVK